VRLTEAAPALAGLEGAVDLATIDKARDWRAKRYGHHGFAAVDEVVLVGGTATSAASVLRGAARRSIATT